MSKPEYVSLHNHSDRSLLDGFATIGEYVSQAKSLGQKAVGLTDHGYESGLYELVKVAKSEGIIPVPGIEAYMAPVNPEGAKVKKPVKYFRGKSDVFGLNKDDSESQIGKDVSGAGAYTHQTIWAYNNVGLKNLYKLSSLSWQQEHFYKKPRIDFEMLADHSEGLIVATGCPSSEISTRLMLGQKKEAYEHATRLKEVFGERLFVEIMNHSMSNDLERILLPQQVELSKKLGIPLLATNDCHYAHAADAPSHERQLCCQAKSRMSEKPYDQGGKRFAFNGEEYYMKTSEQMAELFPENVFPGALSNTILVAEMCQDISIDYNPHLRPSPIIPEKVFDKHGEKIDSPEMFLRHLIQTGFNKKRKNAPQEVKDESIRRILYEMEIIKSNDFVGYFLVVADYMNFARTLTDTLSPGRGSSGGSEICFLLDITNVDPIRFNLLFERFLSTEGRSAIYEIEYDDGTVEKVPVSNKKSVLEEGSKVVEKYIHELAVGDVVGD